MTSRDFCHFLKYIILLLVVCAISRFFFVFIFIGADGYNVPNFVCDIYFNGQEPCFGGVLAIDGKTGV